MTQERPAVCYSSWLMRIHTILIFKLGLLNRVILFELQHHKPTIGGETLYVSELSNSTRIFSTVEETVWWMDSFNALE